MRQEYFRRCNKIKNNHNVTFVWSRLCRYFRHNNINSCICMRWRFLISAVFWFQLLTLNSPGIKKTARPNTKGFCVREHYFVCWTVPRNLCQIVTFSLHSIDKTFYMMWLLCGYYSTLKSIHSSCVVTVDFVEMRYSILKYCLAAVKGFP